MRNGRNSSSKLPCYVHTGRCDSPSSFKYSTSDVLFQQWLQPGHVLNKTIQ